MAKKSTPKGSAGRKSASGGAQRATKKAAAEPTKTPIRRGRPAKPSLTKAELAGFRTTLLAKRRDIVGDMTGIEAQALRKDRQESSGDLSTLPTHPADIGTDNYEQEFTLGLLESERALLEEIDEALQRIEDGTFGICLGTGKPISKARLRARPWSRYCIEYAHMVEKGLVKPESPRSLQDREADEDESEGDTDVETDNGAYSDSEEDDT